MTQTKYQTVTLPQWVLPTASLFSITVIVTALLYSYFNYYFPLELVSGTPRFHLILDLFFLSASGVLGVSFCVYIFNWLREMRPVIRQIEVNTRRSGPSEYRTALAEIASPKQTKPAEDMKYMPKG